MTLHQKYRKAVAAVIGVFVLSALFEVIPRWEELWTLRQNVAAKKEQVKNLSTIGKKHVVLGERKKLLLKLLSSNDVKNEQSSTGALEYLTHTATKNDIKITSLIPTGSKQRGDVEDFGFKVSFAASYHTIGKFLNALETGPMNVKFIKIDVANGTAGTDNLLVSVEGIILLYPSRGRK